MKSLFLYFTSHTFWKKYLKNDTNTRVRKAALNYFRTYFYLIKFESNFCIARNLNLHLVSTRITWAQFYDFSTNLIKICNRNVFERYVYDEIKLIKFNFFASLLFKKLYFQRMNYQYKKYFARFYDSILFMIGIVSIILNGLQIIVTVQSCDFVRDDRILSIVVFWINATMILCSFSIIVFLFFLFLYKIFKKWKYAIRDRLRILKKNRISISIKFEII